jgi:dehypoxanthine futalosine cyclase
MSRVSNVDGVQIYTSESITTLQTLASEKRFEVHPLPIVTFVADTNPNYTNICYVQCSFCAFCRKPNSPDAYHKSLDEMYVIFERARNQGATTVLLQGGLHEGVTIDYLESLVTLCRTNFPSLHPHFFSAPEISFAAKISNITVEEGLKRLFDAGLRTIPGGGAEILSDKVHSVISPGKLSPKEWLDVHRKAHAIGFKTTATMMYGHVETPVDIINHLSEIRSLQDETGGFSSFIPWSYKRDNNPLGKKVTSLASKESYFRLIAFSRIYLDNFPHIAASWFGEGKSAGVEALAFGADDFGGTIFDESVHRATGYVNTSSLQEVVSLIKKAGFIPAERNAMYQIIQTY